MTINLHVCRSDRDAEHDLFIAVPQGCYAVAAADRQPSLLTSGPVRTCFVVTLYDGARRRGLLAHFDAATMVAESVAALFGAFAREQCQGPFLDIHVIGGYDGPASRTLYQTLDKELKRHSALITSRRDHVFSKRKLTEAEDLTLTELFKKLYGPAAAEHKQRVQAKINGLLERESFTQVSLHCATGAVSWSSLLEHYYRIDTCRSYSACAKAVIAELTSDLDAFDSGRLPIDRLYRPLVALEQETGGTP